MVSSPLRIGVVCLHTDPFEPPGAGDVGGMNVVVRNAVTAMAGAGHSVRLWTRRSRPDASETEEIDGVQVRRLAAGPPRPVPKHGHDELIAPFAELLAGDLDDEATGGPDGPAVQVLHSHHWFSGMAALPIARRRGIPHVQSFHSIAAPASAPLSEGERPESPARLEGEALLARSTDAIVAISDAEARTTIDRLGADPAIVHVIPPGVDGTLFHPGAASPAPILLAAARLEPLKGIDVAVRALAGVIDLLPEGASRPRLVVAGGATNDEAYPRELRSLAASLGVGPDVELVGPQTREQLAALMRAATLVLVPSHSETYGLVALEAAASGVPVVATRTGGLEESVIDGVTGVLLPDWDPAVWAAAITALLTSPGERARLGAGGRAHALSRTWSDVAAATVACYQRILGVSA